MEISRILNEPVNVHQPPTEPVVLKCQLLRSGPAPSVPCLGGFGFDIIVVRESTAELDEAVAFFQQVRGMPRLSKGVLALPL